jgi:hypothetical protein
MASMKVDISDEMEKEFRKIAMKVFGNKKDSLNVAAEKAINEWIFKVKKANAIEFIGDPIDAIWGILSNEKTGVELQHEASEIRAKNVFD